MPKTKQLCGWFSGIHRRVNALGKLNWGNRAYAVLVLCATTAVALPAQTFTTLHSFDNTDGASPTAALVQGTDGNFYGTTTGEGGVHDYGTVFKITPSGTLTGLHSFDNTDGFLPYAGLVQATNGSFYGTTEAGGLSEPHFCSEGCGTIFKIAPSGTLTTLYNFCSQSGCRDGASPNGLVQAANGDFYGTTTDYGGAGMFGTVFRITPSGTLTTLHSFCSQSGCTDGYYPAAALVQSTNGEFYGTTYYGGANAGGTVFKITASGTLTTLYSFCSQGGCTDGSYPAAALIQSTNGDFYGTTGRGGVSNHGTVFKITPSGTLTTLYSFCSQSDCMDGSSPVGLVRATNGDFYGTTSEGGLRGPTTCILGCGTVFKITPSGTLTTLYNFCSQSACMDGYYPAAALLQSTNGDFYGTAKYGGANGDGTVFSLSVGLGPFVKTRPHTGKVGAAIQILGNHLTGTTSVSFNGTSAVFNVVSATEINTTVPVGATKGYLQVVTPGGTLSSGGPFLVRP
jgi:uncharacterized repeat protein (TIGR03803 family)